MVLVLDLEMILILFFLPETTVQFWEKKKKNSVTFIVSNPGFRLRKTMPRPLQLWLVLLDVRLEFSFPQKEKECADVV